MTVGIQDVIAEALVEQLETSCQIEVASDDETYVDTIKAGSLNDNPQSTHGNHVLIHCNDPRNPGRWMDSAAMMSRAIGYPGMMLRGEPGVDAAEVGGGENWWRRFAIEVICHYTHLGYTQELAREYASTVIQRVRKALRDNAITGSDDLGERISDVFPKVRWEERYETGDGAKWIWRAYLGIEVLTSVS